MNNRVFTVLASASLVTATLGSAVAPGPSAMAQTQPEWYNCLTREVFTPAKQAWCDRWNTLQNGTYLVPVGFGPQPTLETVTLTRGQYSRPGELLVNLADEPNWMSFGDINGDGRVDAAVIFSVVQGDGHNYTTFLAAVMDVDGEARALTPVVLGERIMLNGPIAIDNQRITVPQLTQTEVIIRSFVIEGTGLNELAQLPSPERANVPDGTVVFSHTPTYAVRVFTRQGLPYLNLFNRTTGRQELNGVRATAIASVAGITYDYAGFAPDGIPAVRLTVARDGAQTIEVNGTMQTDSATVSGTVTYRPRIAMPPNAVLEVQLVDVSRAGAPAIVLASQATVFGDRQVPIPFELVYSPDQIDPRMTLAVQARILVDGQLRFINTSRVPVVPQGPSTPVEVVVDPVGQ
jgi:uncharacterized lipoprotein YbaY